MLSSKKSIFYVGDQEGGHNNTSIRIHAKKNLAHGIRGIVVRQVVQTPSEGHVGLRIAIQEHVHGSNIVLKPLISCGRYKELLKECYLCNKVLSSKMDVYMYRGDLGFCSKECRCQQILRDEQTEAISKQMRLDLTHHSHQQANKSNINISYHHKSILLMA